MPQFIAPFLMKGVVPQAPEDRGVSLKKVLKIDRPSAGGGLGLTGLWPEGCGIAAFGGDEYIVSVTGFGFVSLVLHDEETEPPSTGRGWCRRHRRIGASVLF